MLVLVDLDSIFLKFGTILEMIKIPIGLYCKIDIMVKHLISLVYSVEIIVENLDLNI